jgi:ParB-like chromosome segregation protein Spo0J
MEISRVSIDALIPDPSNARMHDEVNIAAIKGSLAKFGQQKPIVITKTNVVVAGNGTLEAARELGWKDIAVVYSDLSGTEAIAYALSDNRTGELAKWNKDILGKQLLGLSREGFGIASIGFDPKKWIRSGSGNDEEILNSTLDAADKEPKKSKDKKIILSVECKNTVELEELFAELTERGFKVKK